MSNMFSKVGLYEHNQESYKKVKEVFDEGENIVGIVHATGTGKTYNALQLALDNKDKKIIYIVPSNGIIEHIKKIIEENPNLDMERDFPNLEFRTYQSLINLSREEIEDLDIDFMILDEFHHIGAPVWGARINQIIETHEKLKIFGMTAYTVRDRGTSYERDMANPDGGELFSDKIASRYDLCDAMIDGVLPKPIYKSAHIHLLETEQELEKRVSKLDAKSKDYQELMQILKDVRRRIAEAPGIKEVVKKNVKPDGKYIYFCPPMAEDGTNDIEKIKEQALEWFKEYVPEEDIIFYTSTSKMGEEGRDNREAFYNDKTLDGKSADDKLRVMFAINQYNEGIHAPNIDGVIMGRGTQSDIVYFEQLGRALAVRGSTKEKYEEYEKLSKEELIKICSERDILLEDNISKEEIIEMLLSPVVIDLANNYDFIKELENNLQDRIKEIQESSGKTKRKIKLRNAKFDIEIENQNLYEMLRYVFDRLVRTWEDNYELAKAYYEHHGNLEVPYSFKTINGYDYDENGIKIGAWISTQKQSYKNNKLSSERIALLTNIGIKWPINKIEEYIKVVNEIGQIIRRNKAGFNYRFSDGTPMVTYWDSMTKKLYSFVQTQEMQEKYPVGCKVIIEGYQKYQQEKQHRDNHKDINKIEEYIQQVNELGGLITNLKKFKNYQFSDGTPIAMFWYNNTKKLYSFVQTQEMQEKYPVGCKVIIEGYQKYQQEKQHRDNHKDINKIEEYIQQVNELGRLIIKAELDKKYKFSDGKVMIQFWPRNRDKLYNASQASEMAEKYPVGCEIIIQEYLEYQQEKQHRDNYKDVDKIEEYIQKVNELGRLIYPSEKEYVFSNNESMSQFWNYNNNKEKLYNIAQLPEMQEKYPVGCKVIIEKREKYQQEKRHREEHKDINKIEEYIQKVNELGRLIYENEKEYVFSNNESMSHFWRGNNGNNRENLYVASQIPEMQKKYPVGCKVIIEEYQKYQQERQHRENHKDINKIEEYIQKVNELEYLVPRHNRDYYFSDGKLMSNFWIRDNNRKKLHAEAQTEKMQEKYPVGCQIIMEEYLMYQQTQNKKKLKKLIQLCEENNIDVEKNKSIIEHITYEEFIAKINYLNQNGISLTDDNGILHEIFSMSSANMEEKCEITLEELIKEYYASEERKSGM